MNKWELFKELRRHRKLSDARQLDVNKNKVAKVLVYVVVSMVIVYLIGFAISFALIANSMRTMTSVGFICAAAPHLMLFDFLIRFSAQETPSQIIKPYVLLPIKRYTCVNVFLIGQMLNASNLIWFVMLVPFCLMSVVFSYGIGPCLLLLLFFWVMELCISQFYLITRTLITDSLLWWLMPIAVVIVLISPAIEWSDVMAWHFGNNTFNFERMFRLYANVGDVMTDMNILPIIGMMGLLVVLFFINRNIQYSHVMKELGRTTQTEIKKVSEMKALERFGTFGLYAQIELKNILRNKNPRKGFVMAMFVTALFSLVIIFTDVYDNDVMGSFWCLYCYAIFGIMSLLKIMSNEGNYIDCLMIRKENILKLLETKYIINSLWLLLPFLLLLPTVISGKWSLLMLVSYGVFTAGFQYFILFQMAVYNKTTSPLNTKFVGKAAMENNYFQLAAEMFCLFVPVTVVSILQFVFSGMVAHLIMLFIGIAFIATHRLWLRNIYKRFMLHRYQNIESFIASR